MGCFEWRRGYYRRTPNCKRTLKLIGKTFTEWFHRSDDGWKKWTGYLNDIKEPKSFDLNDENYGKYWENHERGAPEWRNLEFRFVKKDESDNNHSTNATEYHL